MFVVGWIGNVSPPPALLIESIEGAMKEPSVALMSAIPRFADTAKSNERYPIEPSVWPIAAATPSFPSPPVPVGHCTALSAPTFVSQSLLWEESHDVYTNVVPVCWNGGRRGLACSAGLRPGSAPRSAG